MNQNVTRSWQDLTVSDRLKSSLNPIRNWAESIAPENEKKYKELIQNKEYQKRPDTQLQFLMGDPTRYPQFVTPQLYRDIASKNVGKINGYTDFFGDSDVRQQLAIKLSNEKWQLSKDDIILTMGGSLALYYCIYSMCNKGDKILMPRPTFPLMHSFAQFLGVQTLWYSLDQNNEWQPNLDEVEQHLKQHNDVRFILINSPSNPLGSIINEQKIMQLIRICEQYNNLPIVSDEIYEHMIYSGQFKFISDYSTTVPILRCSGLTKKALVPGWRLGWLAFFGRPGVFDQIKSGIRGLANILLMPNTICQASLNEVYESCDSMIPNTMKQMAQRFDVFQNNLQGIDGIQVGSSCGAMYATIVIDVEKFENNIKNSCDFATYLQIEENVLVFPGELFMGKDFLRFVICADLDQLSEACQRIRRFCARHHRDNI